MTRKRRCANGSEKVCRWGLNCPSGRVEYSLQPLKEESPNDNEDWQGDWQAVQGLREDIGNYASVLEQEEDA